MQRDFRTILEPKPNGLVIDHGTKVYLSGSCFAENIGKKLKELKFDTATNPFGISYNPISIHKNLIRADVAQIKPNEKEGHYFSYDLHSDLNARTEEEFYNNLQQAIDTQNEYLNAEGVIIITYGTAWVYEENESQRVVNNCHKQRAELFTKRMLSVEEIVASWEQTMKGLSEKYPTKDFIFTISPVRHLKDGFRENQLSKSTLHLAVNEICEAHDTCHYFPAYELLLDDLRDYRFYKDDLLHPNTQAVNYIWENFSACYFKKGTTLLNEQIQKFNTSLHHRAFQPDSVKHQQFLLKLKSKIKAFQLANDLNFKTEIDFLKSQIL